MYSVVLMMAMTSPADDLAFGKRRGGDCTGGAACVGANFGCSGYGYSCVGSGFGCTGVSAGCQGSGRGGFLGLGILFKNRGAAGNCCGAPTCGCVGYVAPAYNNCCGYTPRCGCTGHVAPVYRAGCGCCGVPAPACCGTHAIATFGGCGCGPVHGVPVVGAPAMGSAPVAGEQPAAGGTGTPPVKMPEPPKK